MRIKTKEQYLAYIPKFITEYAEDGVRLGRVRNPEWSE